MCPCHSTSHGTSHGDTEKKTDSYKELPTVYQENRRVSQHSPWMWPGEAEYTVGRGTRPAVWGPGQDSSLFF